MILEKILANKHIEVAELKRRFDYREAFKTMEKLPAARSLAGSLKKPGQVCLLAEIKGASPSRGVIRRDFDPRRIARIYADNGADAISVLTDYRFFAGRPEYLANVREVTDLPLLRKDFIIDPVQIYEARLIGADAVLLVCAALDAKRLRELMAAAASAGLESLVEVHDRADLETALAAGAHLIGINNRDLKTFNTDISTTFELCRKINTDSLTVVSESGIKSYAHMQALGAAGVSAALVGQAVMAAPDIAAKVRELKGIS